MSGRSAPSEGDVLRVWGRATSANVQKVMWAVTELGLTAERVDAGGAFGGLDTPAFAAMNPNRLVPVIDDGGFTLWESDAIVRHLATTYGRGGIMPADAKDAARADQWMSFSAMGLYPDIISTLFHGLVRTPAAERNTAAIEAAARRAGERLAVLDAHLAGRAFVLGDTLTVADIPAGTLMYRYHTLPVARPSLPNVAAWYARLQERPGYRAHVMIDYQVLKVPGA
jgi:glutathione S-transferase